MTSNIDYEENILNKWKDMELMYKYDNSLPLFRFMDGPPFPNSSNLHFGHILIGVAKDTVLRYKSMNGYNCLNKIGYDCHGLPIEMAANKDLKISTKQDIIDYGIDKYNDHCKKLINEYSGSWKPIYDRIGRHIDYNNSYKTMDKEYMESVWWTFKQLYDKNLIYKAHQVVPYSPSCGSSLSNFESSQNYKTISTKSVYVLFKSIYKNIPINFVAWTTTPWTLFSNIALCVGPNIEYCLVNNLYIVSKKSVKNINVEIISVLDIGNGNSLVGLEYEPVFDYYKNDFKFMIVQDNYVLDDGTGTGIVHLAPCFGVDDYRICCNNKLVNENQIDYLCCIDDNGYYTSKIEAFSQKNILDVSDDIIKTLKINNKLLKSEMITHEYPHCPRTDNKLIYRALSNYFVDVISIKDKLLENNNKITWIPESIGSGRFKQWLENVRDWNISRSRFFGTPLPLWISDDGEEKICVGSIQELYDLTGIMVDDLHIDNIDKIKIPSRQNKGFLTRVPDVFDCWFESGAVPIAQYHYPFDNVNIYDNEEYLSDFIVEGLDQTRGWFYTLLVLSTAIFNKPAYKHVICTGLVLAEDGKKFSKKYGNYVNPVKLINDESADILRLYLLNSPLLQGDSYKFNMSHVKMTRQHILPLINAAKLLSSQIYNFEIKHNELNLDLVSNNIFDKWILIKINKLLISVKLYMDIYSIDKAIQEILKFIDTLTNCYIQLNRERIRGLCEYDEYHKSLVTLYTVILTYIKISAPFMPFLCEYIYGLMKCMNNKSVHYEKYPVPTITSYNDNEIEKKIDELYQVITLGRKLRKLKIKSQKQPIKSVNIYHPDNIYLENLQHHDELIKNDLNAEKIMYIKTTDDNIKYTLVPNFKSIGMKFKKNVNDVKNLLLNLDQLSIKNILNQETFKINEYELSRNDIDVVKTININTDGNYLTEIDGLLMMAIDLTYDENMHEQYQLRLLCSHIQQLRKKSQLNPWDQITVNLTSDVNLNIELITKRLLCPVTINDNICANSYITNTFEYKDFNDNIFIIKINIS